MHSDYGRNDNIAIGDGLSIPITHNGSTTFSSYDSHFQLNNVVTPNPGGLIDNPSTRGIFVDVG